MTAAFETAFGEAFSAQLALHPSMAAQDAVKLCYQAARGAEHLLFDAHAARARLDAEFDAVEAADAPLYEPIAGDVCRVNLAAWKARAYPLSWLFSLFCGSAAARPDADARMEAYLSAVGRFAEDGRTPFSAEAWRAFLAAYRSAGMPAVHHSEAYREAEHPSYRIASGVYFRMLPILERAYPYARDNKRCIIAIDGRAASGKTTLAAALCSVLDASSVHADHFFLPTELRTPARRNEVGGNIHYERFIAEVLPHLRTDAPFFYRVFDCASMEYRGAHAVTNAGPFTVVEGAYCLHPKFGDYADITVFSDAAPDEQAVRIRSRDGEAALETFRSRWIPMEEAYIKATGLAKRVMLTV